MQQPNPLLIVDSSDASLQLLSTHKENDEFELYSGAPGMPENRRETLSP